MLQHGPAAVKYTHTHTHTAKTRRCGPVLGLDRHSLLVCLPEEVIVLEASKTLTECTQHSEWNPFSICLHFSIPHFARWYYCCAQYVLLLLIGRIGSGCPFATASHKLGRHSFAS